MNITRLTKHTVAGVLAAATLIPCLAFANPATKASGAPAGLSQRGTAAAGGATASPVAAVKGCQTDAQCDAPRRCYRGACVDQPRAEPLSATSPLKLNKARSVKLDKSRSGPNSGLHWSRVAPSNRGFGKAEFALAFASGLAGAAVGTGLGTLTERLFEEFDFIDGFKGTGGFYSPTRREQLELTYGYLAPIGATAMATVGVSLYGRKAGFYGSELATAAGATVGGLVSAVVNHLVLSGDARANPGSAEVSAGSCAVLVSSTLILPALGAALGYKLSLRAPDTDDAPQRTSGALLDHTPGMGLGFSAPAVSPIMGKQGVIGGHLKLLGGQF